MSEDVNVAAELAALRGAMDVGFARVTGRLDLISEKQDRTTRDLEDLDERVTALEARRWPVGMIVAISGCMSAVGAALGLLAK